MSTERDYYAILGLEREATAEDIKRSYRRLAMKYHPDRNPGDAEAEKSFKECAEAYEVLADPERRSIYDRFGHAGLRSTPGHDFRSMNVEDIFSMFGDIFGGFNRPRGRQRGGVPRGYDLETEVEIDLEEVSTGAERDVEFKRLDVCEACGGLGARAGTRPEQCGTCRGQGQVAQQGLGGMFRMVINCPHCQGRGTVIADPCPDCRGDGRVSVHRELRVKLPPGIHHGQAVRVAQEGEPPPPEISPSGEGIRGDLHVLVRVGEHSRFERDGDHLLVMVPVGFAQAALGSDIEVPTLQGSTKLTVPAGTQHGATFRVPETGLPNLRGKKKGDLVVIVQLIVPKNLTEEQEKLLAEYAKTENLEVATSAPSIWERLKGAVSPG